LGGRECLLSRVTAYDEKQIRLTEMLHALVKKAAWQKEKLQGLKEKLQGPKEKLQGPKEKLKGRKEKL